MPPFPPASVTPASSHPTSPASAGSTHLPTVEESSHSGATSFTSILKSFGRGVVKASSSVTAPATETSSDASHARVRKTGSSSRHAGVRPARNASGGAASISARDVADEDFEYLMQRGMIHDLGVPIAGPSRGGFVSRLHAPIAASSKASPSLVTTTTSPSATLSSKDRKLQSPPMAGTIPLPTTTTIQSRRAESIAPASPMSISVASVELPPLEDTPVPPPSKILPRLSALAQKTLDPLPLLPLIRLLASSVSLYPFPPPTLAAASLSAALEVHSTTPRGESLALDLNRKSGPAPTPTPLQIHLSQSHLLERGSSAQVRKVLLELLLACVEASLGTTGGIMESEKAVYWEEARRWAEEAREDVTDGEGVIRWRLPDADREGIVAVLSALTRGGRDLSDVPGLVALLCTFVTDSLPSPAPPSPLFDSHHAITFIRGPPGSAPHASSLALLIALHKFSSPHIYAASTLMALRATLEVARSQDERDLSGVSGVLALLGAVVRFTQVTTGESHRGGKEAIRETDGDEILREVVSVVARMIGCEGLVGVVEVEAGVQQLPNVYDERIKPSILPPVALELMRDLLRSPAHQALKSLRNSLVAPPTDSPIPPPPILLLVGTLRSLRNALLEHAADTEATSHREGSSQLIGETRWPSMLSLGLPFLWNGLNRVMLWESEYIDAEVLGLVAERIEASSRNEKSRGKEGETSGETGVSYEEWDMAIEVLSKAKKHISAWEEKKKRYWILEGSLPHFIHLSPLSLVLIAIEYSGVLEDDFGSFMPGSPGVRRTDVFFLRTIEVSSPNADRDQIFTPRPTVLSTFKVLLQKVITAWRSPDFTGPSERLFSLLLDIAPHLSESDALSIIDQCERDGLCLPSHPEWIDRIQDVLKAFYTLPPVKSPNGRMNGHRVTSAVTRRRALQLFSSVHSHVRRLGALQDKLVETVFLPLLGSTLEGEADVDVAGDLMILVIQVAKDVLYSEEEDGKEETIGVFDRIRALLLRISKGAVRPVDRYSTSVPPTIGTRLGAGFNSLSRHSKEASISSTLRSSPSISKPISTSPRPESTTVPYLAVLALISLFHLCLARSTRPSSERGIPIFRDLLALAVPPRDTTIPDSTVSVRARFVILQWLVRLRADANHRIHLIRDVDISGAATVLGRIGVVPDAATDALSDAMRRTSEDGIQPETRGRSARGTEGGGTRGDREGSGSRTRIGSEDRNRAISRSRSSVPSFPNTMTTPTLWTVPETLPFDLDFATVARGITGLSSFDHNRMRDWTEEEDPGTGLMKVKEVEDVPPPANEMMIVLPVSEYFGAIHRLLSYEVEWELVSYVLCHLPEQLSNKHFACGPRAGQQLHALRRQLCDGLRGGDRALLADVVLPAGVKRAEVNAVAYHCLTSLIAYRSLFKKSQQDEMVETFIYGLGNPRDTAKPCIHALAMACFELRPSMTKYLAEIVRHLQKIISSETLGVHILEFIAGVGQEPVLYANFTEQDFQTVFGIAIKYIQAHNDRAGEDSTSGNGDDLSYAFSQYVFLLAYYSIAAWYMALRLSERPKYVAFLIRRLVQANEGRAEIDEATEVCFDMIARYAYSNADPRPRASTFDKLITTGRTATSISKTWVIGTALVSIKNLESPAWVEVTIRRPSGVVKMLWELQNVSGVASSSDCDLIAMHFRHRETAQLSSNSIASIVSSALASLPSTSTTTRPHLGKKARAASFSGFDSNLSPNNRFERDTISSVLNSGATNASEPTLESGPLAVDPSFFALQLSSIPDFGASGPPLLVPAEPSYQRGVNILDTMPVVDFHKVGVLYAGPGQRTESEILGNIHGSKAYIELISGLGRLVRLKGCRELDVYTGGLDSETDIDGKWTYVWDDDISQIVFHVATLMPTSMTTDPLSTLKKRHIGNDYVKIIFNDSGGEFAFDTLPGDFNFVNIVIQPHTPAGNPWVGPGMTNNAEFFKVSMQCRAGMPEIGPLGSFKMVTGSSLPSFVRQLSLHSNLFAQIYLATVGIEARQGTQKVEYSSNWRRRLQAIKRLRERLGGESVLRDEKTRLDLDSEETARSFTSWL